MTFCTMRPPATRLPWPALARLGFGVLPLFAGPWSCAPHPPAPPATAPAAAPALGATAAAPLPPGGRVPGVDNFGVVSADVWRGARPTPQGLRALAALGVRTVIDLQERDESADVPPGVRYVPLRVSQWHADRVDTAAVLKAIADNPKPVFVHCLEGRDRTGLAVAAYRLSQGATADDAVRELDQYHVNVWWRPFIVRRVNEMASRPGTAAAAVPVPRGLPPSAAGNP